MKETEVVLEFNQEDLDEFIKQWNKAHPRSRKGCPIENKPLPRSLNKMLVVTNRIVQNNMKQVAKEYVMFVANKYGMNDLYISECDLEITYTFPTKVRHDLDNLVGGMKEWMDGLSSGEGIGMLVDDNYYVVKSIKATGKYEKGVTKTTLTFKNCKYDEELGRVTTEKELARISKREETMKSKKASKTKTKKTSKKKTTK